jgi:hypothetical protein
MSLLLPLPRQPIVRSSPPDIGEKASSPVTMDAGLADAVHAAARPRAEPPAVPTNRTHSPRPAYHLD